jgi:hypothetical protein
MISPNRFNAVLNKCVFTAAIGMAEMQDTNSK